MGFLKALLLQCLFIRGFAKDSYGPKFPDDFLFGVSTSAYQIEGAWNEDGKGENIWDRLVHTNPKSIRYKHNADETVNSYYLYKRDIEMLRELGVDHYRFSISWSRILPSGRSDFVNIEGVKYYNNLINELLKYNITPMVTLYHWDLPQQIEDVGGFLNDKFPQIFEDYAGVAFVLFGDRVKYWITFNEPNEICVEGYGMNIRAPRRNLHGYGEYICTKNLLVAHAKAYHLYNNFYKPVYNGKVGFSVGVQWAEPWTDSEDDKKSAEDALQFYVGLFTHPIFTSKGGFPKEVIDRVPKERLGVLPTYPEIRNTSDFIGINHYDMFYTTRSVPLLNKIIPSFVNDLDVYAVYLNRWSKEWISNGVTGFGKLLDWIKNNCNDPLIIITENGLSGVPGLEDLQRVWFYRRYLAETLLAINRGVNVKGYFPWSLMDNFEWQRGYTERYGFYEVDFNDQDKIRTPRRSMYAYRHIIQTKTINPDYMNNEMWNMESNLDVLTNYTFLPEFSRRPSLGSAIKKNMGKNKTKVEIIISALNSQILTFDTPYQFTGQ